MAEHKPAVHLVDDHAVTMFYACALDLLAQTEAQHRTLVEAHMRLESCVAEWKHQPPTPEGRRERLSVITSMVHEVVGAIRAQRAVATDMQKAMSALQANSESS